MDAASYRFLVRSSHPLVHHHYYYHMLARHTHARWHILYCTVVFCSVVWYSVRVVVRVRAILGLVLAHI